MTEKREPVISNLSDDEVRAIATRVGRALSDAIRLNGQPIAAIQRNSGVSRQTIYRIIEGNGPLAGLDKYAALAKEVGVELPPLLDGRVVPIASPGVSPQRALDLEGRLEAMSAEVERLKSQVSRPQFSPEVTATIQRMVNERMAIEEREAVRAQRDAEIDRATRDRERQVADDAPQTEPGTRPRRRRAG